MKRLIVRIYSVIFMVCFFNMCGYGQEIDLKQLEDGIYMHPAKNALEVRVSSEDLRNPDYNYKGLAQKVSSLFKDDFDAYVFVMNMEGDETSLGGWASVVNNHIEGIGMETFASEEFSGLRRLRGVILLTGYRFLFQGALLHEICHLYAAPDLGQVEVDADGNEIDTGGHWGISDVGGQLGGFDVASLSVSEKNYRATCWIAQFFNEDFNGFNMEGVCNWKYAPLELYLMGLAPISEVPNLHIYRGITNTNSELIKKEGTCTATEVITYTPDDLLKKWGKRVPDYTDSPKELSILSIVVTDEPVTAEKWALIQDDIAKQESREAIGETFPINFYKATSGRGCLKFGGINESLYNDVTANEIVGKKSVLKVSGKVIYSSKEIVRVKSFDWAGKLLNDRPFSTMQIDLSLLKGNILVFEFADGTNETLKSI